MGAYRGGAVAAGIASAATGNLRIGLLDDGWAAAPRSNPYNTTFSRPTLSIKSNAAFIMMKL